MMAKSLKFIGAYWGPREQDFESVVRCIVEFMIKIKDFDLIFDIDYYETARVKKEALRNPIIINDYESVYNWLKKGEKNEIINSQIGLSKSFWGLLKGGNSLKISFTLGSLSKVNQNVFYIDFELPVFNGEKEKIRKLTALFNEFWDTDRIKLNI